MRINFPSWRAYWKVRIYDHSHACLERKPYGGKHFRNYPSSSRSRTGCACKLSIENISDTILPQGIIYWRVRGFLIAQVAQRFCVGVVSVMRWIKIPDPKTIRNKPATKVDMEMLAQDVKDHPDVYQYERAKRLGVSAACSSWTTRHSTNGRVSKPPLPVPGTRLNNFRLILQTPMILSQSGPRLKQSEKGKMFRRAALCCTCIFESFYIGSAISTTN